jgi:SAM-dependent methyltransferase
MAFYRTFAEKKLTRLGGSRRGRIERARFHLATRSLRDGADVLEIGPGQGGIADLAHEAGYRYQAVEPSPQLALELQARGVAVHQAFTPPFPIADQSQDLVYADQVLEHMSGIEAARHWVSEAQRVLRPGGRLFAVVPDYLKEKEFFWDVDYTHNFITTERRERQLLYDGGFIIDDLVRSIGLATGLGRDVLAGAALLVNLPGLTPLFRHLGAEEFLFKIRKNLFETLAFVARKPID